MKINQININQKFKKINDFWSPKVIAQMNDYQFKLAKIKGEFIWHNHKDTDETFIVVEGSMILKFRDGEVHLSKGEMCVVPKGVDHKPIAKSECKILVIEPSGVVNTGDTVGDLTINEEMWI